MLLSMLAAFRGTAACRGAADIPWRWQSQACRLCARMLCCTVHRSVQKRVVFICKSMLEHACMPLTPLVLVVSCSIQKAPCLPHVRFQAPSSASSSHRAYTLPLLFPHGRSFHVLSPLKYSSLSGGGSRVLRGRQPRVPSCWQVWSLAPMQPRPWPTWGYPPQQGPPMQMLPMQPMPTNCPMHKVGLGFCCHLYPFYLFWHTRSGCSGACCANSSGLFDMVYAQVYPLLVCCTCLAFPQLSCVASPLGGRGYPILHSAMPTPSRGSHAY